MFIFLRFIGCIKILNYLCVEKSTWYSTVPSSLSPTISHKWIILILDLRFSIMIFKTSGFAFWMHSFGPNLSTLSILNCLAKLLTAHADPQVVNWWLSWKSWCLHYTKIERKNFIWVFFRTRPRKDSNNFLSTCFGRVQNKTQIYFLRIVLDVSKTRPYFFFLRLVSDKSETKLKLISSNLFRLHPKKSSNLFPSTCLRSFRNKTQINFFIQYRSEVSKNLAKPLTRGCWLNDVSRETTFYFFWSYWLELFPWQSQLLIWNQPPLLDLPETQRLQYPTRSEHLPNQSL